MLPVHCSQIPLIFTRFRHHARNMAGWAYLQVARSAFVPTDGPSCLLIWESTRCNNAAFRRWRGAPSTPGTIMMQWTESNEILLVWPTNSRPRGGTENGRRIRRSRLTYAMPLGIQFPGWTVALTILEGQQPINRPSDQDSRRSLQHEVGNGCLDESPSRMRADVTPGHGKPFCGGFGTKRNIAARW